MRAARLYLVLCVLGAILPHWQLARFYAENGFTIFGYLEGMLETRVASALALDLAVSLAAFLGFVFIDGPRRGMRHLWIYAVLGVVALSFALPFYLYRRTIAGKEPPGRDGRLNARTGGVGGRGLLRTDDPGESTRRGGG